MDDIGALAEFWRGTRPIPLERYAAFSDDELQNVVIDSGLTDNARELLDQELHRRGITDVTEYREYPQRLDQERRTEKQQGPATQRKLYSPLQLLGLPYLALRNIRWSFCFIYSERREKRRRHDHRKRYLVSIGLDYCEGSAAGMAILVEAIKLDLGPMPCRT